MRTVLLAFVTLSLMDAVRSARNRAQGLPIGFDFRAFGLALASWIAIFVSIRFTWLIVFPLLYVFPRINLPPVGRAFIAGIATLVLAGWFVLSVPIQTKIAWLQTHWSAYLSTPFRVHKFHAEGVSRLADSGLAGRVFNPYWMGGFISYWLGPDVQVFVDGRTEHYSTDVYLDYSAITTMDRRPPNKDFIDILRDHEVNLFFGVGYPGWFLEMDTVRHLENAPGWLLISRSYRHAIYLRADDIENANRVVAHYQELGVPFDKKAGLDIDRVVDEQPAWAARTTLLPRDYADRRAQAKAGSSEAMHDLAVIYSLIGAYRHAIETDRRLLAKNGQNTEASVRLLHNLLRVDRLREARDLLDALPPNQQWAVFNGRARHALSLLEKQLAPPRSEDAQIVRNRVLKDLFLVSPTRTWRLEFSFDTQQFADALTAHRGRASVTELEGSPPRQDLVFHQTPPKRD
ncbi:MAG: hypothetical protein AAF493_17935 [Pseudomonadota bacterium]